MKQQNKTGFGTKVRCLLLAAQALAAISRADNINWGPFRLNVGVTAGVEFDDNGNTSQHHPESSLALTLGPTISGILNLPVTLPGGEQLSLNTGLSYSYKLSLFGPVASTFSSPITASLVLPMRIEQWVVVAGDAFTFTNEPLESTFAANRTKVPQYNNDASVSGTRQFGRFALTLATGRTDKIFPDDPSLEEVQYQFSLTPAFYLRENYSIFLRNSVGLVYPKEMTRQETIGISSEVGVSGQVTPYLNGSVSVGFAHSHLLAKTFQIDQGGIFGGAFDTTTIPADNVDGITSTLALNYSHPLRPNTTYQISAFRSPGVTAVLQNSNITETYGVNLSIQQRLSSSVTLTPTISWTHAADLSRKTTTGGVSLGSGEVTDLVAVGLGLNRVLTRKLTANFSYRFQARSSNLANASYEDNRITLDFNYSF